MMPAAQQRAHDAFVRHFGERPDGIAFAPGRVNLIGDHVDYNDGLVMPMPLELGTAVAWRSGNGQSIRAVAADFGDAAYTLGSSSNAEGGGDWRAYLRGMAHVLDASARDGRSLDLAIAGDLPRGAGLSSSASYCIALGRAFIAAELAEPIVPVDLARAAQRTEHEYAGVSCGIMDQMASACGMEGHAMLLDCRTLGWRNFALPEDWAVMIVPSGATRGLVDGEYNLRREQCQQAARLLGVASLRDVTSAALDGADLPDLEHRRARHVVDETARVGDAAGYAAREDLAGLGNCLNHSHRSLRDLFEVSHPVVDRLAAILQRAIGRDGGARMTGGGFGGAVVAIAARSELDRLRGIVAREFSPVAAAKTLIAGNCRAPDRNDRHQSGRSNFQ